PAAPTHPRSFPTRRSSDLAPAPPAECSADLGAHLHHRPGIDLRRYRRTGHVRKPVQLALAGWGELGPLPYRHGAQPDLSRRRTEDRKSTRLNSSHVSISYA